MEIALQLKKSQILAFLQYYTVTAKKLALPDI